MECLKSKRTYGHRTALYHFPQILMQSHRALVIGFYIAFLTGKSFYICPYVRRYKKALYGKDLRTDIEFFCMSAHVRKTQNQSISA